MKPHWSSVAIVGVGLIGGSVGQALLGRRLAGRVIGIGRDPASLAEAKRCGAVTETTTDLAAVAGADFVLVATGVAAIPALLERIDDAVRPGTAITDAGSTKGRIVAGWERHRRRRRGRFVGGHPLAGSHRRGPTAADADLFTGRVAVVTPAPATPADDVEAVAGFWSALGATVYVMPPREHDRILAATSHAPHAVAAAVAAATPAAARRFTAGGWRDTTRIAAGDPALWADILLDNAAEVQRALARVLRRAARLQEAIERRDRRAVETLLTRAKEARDAVGS
ncbi:MAG: prephenate dehydrogenase [Planctomycetes bacterium]|nr:prephenate dehydrogenase [Planctomycetota bacterium]